MIYYANIGEVRSYKIAGLLRDSGDVVHLEIYIFYNGIVTM